MNDLDVKQALVICAHPDDPEFSAGGTVAAWSEAGATVDYLVVTDGSKGSADRDADPAHLIALRKDEQRAAADVLGVRDVHFLGRVDGELVADLDLRYAITRVIRRLRPDTVITQDPTTRYWDQYVNHPDHIATGEATLAAIYPTARDHLNAPFLLEEGLEPHKVKTLLLSSSKHADTWIDISGTFDRKIKALLAHKSQMGDWDELEKFMRERHKETAAAADAPMELAEAFKRITLP